GISTQAQTGTVSTPAASVDTDVAAMDAQALGEQGRAGGFAAQDQQGGKGAFGEPTGSRGFAPGIASPSLAAFDTMTYAPTAPVATPAPPAAEVAQDRSGRAVAAPAEPSAGIAAAPAAEVAQDVPAVAPAAPVAESLNVAAPDIDQTDQFGGRFGGP